MGNYQPSVATFRPELYNSMVNQEWKFYRSIERYACCRVISATSSHIVLRAARRETPEKDMWVDLYVDPNIKNTQGFSDRVKQEISVFRYLHALSPKCSTGVVCYSDAFLLGYDQKCYYAFEKEYADAENMVLQKVMYALMSAQISIPKIDLRRMIRSLLCSVSYLHSLGIAHQDIKPENIAINSYHVLLTNLRSTWCDKKVIIQVFGQEAQNEADYTDKLGCVHALSVGTPLYQNSVDMGHSTVLQRDIWALGLTLYQLTHNMSFPFEDDIVNQYESTNEILNPVDFSGKMLFTYTSGDLVIDKIIERCLTMDAAKRATAQELLTYFPTEEQQASSPPSTPRRTQTATDPPTPRREEPDLVLNNIYPNNSNQYLRVPRRR